VVEAFLDLKGQGRAGSVGLRPTVGSASLRLAAGSG